LLQQGHSFQSFLQRLKLKKSTQSAATSMSAAALPCKGSHRALGTERCFQYAEMIRSANHKRWGGRLLGPLIRYFSSLLFGLFFTILLKVMNRFTSHRVETLLHNVFHRPDGKGLLTVSNHQSVVDDPGLWAVVLPWWRLDPNKLRWAICTEDVFFHVSNILHNNG
jgi:hypothetical protein